MSLSCSTSESASETPVKSGAHAWASATFVRDPRGVPSFWLHLVWLGPRCCSPLGREPVRDDLFLTLSLSAILPFKYIYLFLLIYNERNWYLSTIKNVCSQKVLDQRTQRKTVITASPRTKGWQDGLGPFDLHSVVSAQSKALPQPQATAGWNRHRAGPPPLHTKLHDLRLCRPHTLSLLTHCLTGR